jgi:hypothetical protein
MKNSIQQKKEELIKWLSSVYDEDVLHSIYQVRERSTAYGLRLTSKERQAIEEGREDIKQGRYKPHSEVRKLYEHYL